MKHAYITCLMLLFCSTIMAVEVLPPTVSQAAPMDEYTTVISYPVPGSSAGATSKAMVVVPRDYGRSEGNGTSAKRYSVVYLLHGYNASHLRYHEKLGEAGKSLTDLADRFGVILVMPDGKPSSWYLDAPVDVPDSADWQIETMMVKHLIPQVDRRYRTWAERSGRGVTGISMGGHGAIYLSARNPDVFAAAASMSGIMDLRESLNPAPLAARIGSFEQHRDRWTGYSALAHAEHFIGRDTALLLDCGWEDPFIWSNRALHDKLMRFNVPHDYIERPGKHDWDYWINALPYHLQFLTDRLKPAGMP